MRVSRSAENPADAGDAGVSSVLDVCACAFRMMVAQMAINMILMIGKVGVMESVFFKVGKMEKSSKS
jgi:hypothetical protein